MHLAKLKAKKYLKSKPIKLNKQEHRKRRKKKKKPTVIGGRRSLSLEGGSFSNVPVRHGGKQVFLRGI
jgi:hypothetical protein